MIRFALSFALSSILASQLSAQDAGTLAGKRVVFLGDSITQSGGYVAITTYYLEKLHPRKDFDILSLGLASETLSGLSEENHAGGKFPRPCLFERLGRLLEKAKPDVVFACYGIPFASSTIACGKSNSPSPLPFAPHCLISLPSREYFITREFP